MLMSAAIALGLPYSVYEMTYLPTPDSHFSDVDLC